MHRICAHCLSKVSGIELPSITGGLLDLHRNTCRRITSLSSSRSIRCKTKRTEAPLFSRERDAVLADRGWFEIDVSSVRSLARDSQRMPEE